MGKNSDVETKHRTYFSGTFLPDDERNADETEITKGRMILKKISCPPGKALWKTGALVPNEE